MARMEKKLLDKVSKAGAEKVFAYAINEEIEGYLLRRGYEKMPWSIWAKEI